MLSCTEWKVEQHDLIRRDRLHPVAAVEFVAGFHFVDAFALGEEHRDGAVLDQLGGVLIWIGRRARPHRRRRRDRSGRRNPAARTEQFTRRLAERIAFGKRETPGLTNGRRGLTLRRDFCGRGEFVVGRGRREPRQSDGGQPCDDDSDPSCPRLQ